MLHVGTSGWQYRDWRGAFYPRGLPQARWLEHYAERFATVEVNSTFYGLPRSTTFQTWADRSPPDFMFALKLSRLLTHTVRLERPEETIEQFFENAHHLGPKLGPVLLQLPPTRTAAPAILDRALRALPAGVRVAVEFRHASWFTDEVKALLTEHGAALCLADRESRPITPLWRTADWGYVRMHTGRGRPRPCYGRAAPRRWAQRIADLWHPDSDVFVFFNNDPNGCAPRDARTLALAARHLGWECARIPGAREVRIRRPSRASLAG